MPDPVLLPVVAEVTRSGFVESRHHGSVVVLAADGSVVTSVGVPDAPVLTRSCLKPLQALAVLRSGVALDPDLLAVACSSHSGEDRHVDLVRRILESAGLGPQDLDNTPAPPLADPCAPPDRLRQNCSGKHAAMLAACAVNGWPTHGYLDPAHPVQQAVLAAVADLTGDTPVAVTVDGCGAPQPAIGLTALARGFLRLVRPYGDSSERRVADAMRAHPWVVGGTGRDVTGLMEAVPGLLAKDGAEGTYVAGHADHGAVAVKIEDGSGRARTPVLVAGLRAIGVDQAALAELAAVPVLGHGRPVGEVRAALPG